MVGNEAFARVQSDAQPRDAGWTVADGRSIRFEYPLADGTRADYVLCAEQGRPMAVLEAKRASASLGAVELQSIAYARSLDLGFLANGEEARFRDLATDAYCRPVAAVFARRVAVKTLRRPAAAVAIDRRIVDRPCQRDWIETLCRAIEQGRRKLLVEMATGIGKTRTAATFIKRLLEANAVARALVLEDA